MLVYQKKLYFCKTILRGRAVVARRAHNPEVAGSSPAPATKRCDLFYTSHIFFVHHFFSSNNWSIFFSSMSNFSFTSSLLSLTMASTNMELMNDMPMIPPMISSIQK